MNAKGCVDYKIMCAIIKTETETIETIGELREIAPWLVLDKNYLEIPDSPDCCLCPLDIVATAKANGFSVEQDDCGDYLMKGNTTEGK